jgi:protein involved in polysaccharide export with SLBB domain
MLPVLMQIMFVLSLLLLLLALPTHATAQTDGGEPAGVSLQPGDVIKVEIWREEDLSGEFIVNESGTVTLPLLGERQATGIPLHALRDSLTADYRVHLRNPSITITPLRRVYVLGEVNEAGLYTVDPTVSLAGAVALAGGANPQGDLRRIRVVRGGQVVLRNVPAESALASLDIRSGDQIFVDRRGWFDRNSTFLVSMILSVTSIIVTLAQQGQ